MYEAIEKFMGIDSTAEGYDIVVLKKTKNPNHCTISRRYKNVSAATMKRFYQLSNSMMSISRNTSIHYRKHRNIFEDK